MRIVFPHPKSNINKTRIDLSQQAIKVLRLFFIFILSLSITFSNFAQDEDSDFLDKVLDEKPKKADSKKALAQSQNPNSSSKDKKKKSTKNQKKNSKPVAKTTDINKKPKPINPETANTNNPAIPQINNNKLNLEYWVHEELTMSPQSIPGFEEPKTANSANPPLANTVTEKPAEKKNPEKTVEKESKPNPFLAFLNEYKKIIFIFAAIIIFAIYRLRYAGARNYNNSGRIFSKFRNK